MTTSGAIDIHTHIVPRSFPAYAGRHANVRWPRWRRRTTAIIATS